MEKLRIAVILPSGRIYDLIFADGIAPMADDAGAELVRISTDLSQSAFQSALDKLNKSQAVIADVTASNPNVMFLAGCATALKKPVTYIAHYSVDFPFKTINDAIIHGGDSKFLKAELIAHFTVRAVRDGNEITKADARTKFMSVFGDLLVKHGYQQRGGIIEEQPNVYALLEQDMDLPLVQEIARRGRELGIRVKLM